MTALPSDDKSLSADDLRQLLAQREAEIADLMRTLAGLEREASRLEDDREYNAGLCREREAEIAQLRSLHRPEPIAQSSVDRAEPIRRDLARLLDNLYGLYVRPGHIDAVLDVFHLHAPVKVRLEAREAEIAALRQLPDALREAAGMTDKALDLLRREHFVFHRFPRDMVKEPPVTDGERWEALAFWLYSEMAQVASHAQAALDEALALRAEGPAPPPEP